MEYGKDDFVIEIDMKGNANGIFPPLGRRGPLRGRYDPLRNNPGARRVEGKPALLNREVPGMHICLNVEAATCRVVDPLGDEEYSSLRAEIAKSQGSEFCHPVEETSRDGLKQWEVASFYYWMVEWLKRGHAKLVHSQVPEGRLEAKQPPGRIRKDYWATHPYDKKTRTGTPRFQDEFDHYLAMDEPEVSVVAGT